MSKDLVKWLINECEILLIKIFYLEKMNDKEKPTFNLPVRNFEDERKEKKVLFSYMNKVRKRKVKVKAYFTLLIFDLAYILNLNEDLKNIAKNMKAGSLGKRFKTTFKKVKVLSVENMYDLIFFLRDAIAHPEEKSGEVSPRRSVKYNFDVSDTFMTGGYDESTDDIIYQIGDCKISFKEMNNLLKRLKDKFLKSE